MTTKQNVISFDEFLTVSVVKEYDTVEVAPSKYVRIGSLTAQQWIEWQEEKDDPKAKETSTSKLIARSLVDAEGKRIGDESKLAGMLQINLRVSEVLLKAIMRLNGVNQPDKPPAPQQVAAAKND